jgi:flagellar hook-associated protein 1
MSIASALNNAGTGLTAAARLADTVSNNVANAMSEGFARRTTDLSSVALGGYGSGVRILGTGRAENPYMTAERRAMDAAASAAGTLGEAYDRMLAAIGEPGSPAALASRSSALESALLGAVASPQSFAKLSNAVEAAGALARSINSIAAETARMRTEANQEIVRQVDTVNKALAEIDGLNAKIRLGRQQGLDTNGLEDERARQIDRIAEIIPVRTVKREQGEIAVYSQNGGVMLDGRVWPLEFDPGPSVLTPEMTLQNGMLNGLRQDRGAIAGPDAIAIGEGSGLGLMDGGSLAALFEIRDKFSVEINRELDLYARDLMDRFRTPPPAGLMPPDALDGGEGLFVDTAAGPTLGLAGRLALNAAVNPAAGGDVRLLRDGLDGTPRPEGFAVFLEAMADAMTQPRDPGLIDPPLTLASTSAANGASGFAAEIAAYFGSRAARGDEARAYLTAQRAVLSERETDTLGVDTDAQLQFLMLLEQTYAANARVLTVIDSLLKQLLEI